MVPLLAGGGDVGGKRDRLRVDEQGARRVHGANDCGRLDGRVDRERIHEHGAHTRRHGERLGSGRTYDAHGTDAGIRLGVAREAGAANDVVRAIVREISDVAFGVQRDGQAAANECRLDGQQFTPLQLLVQQRVWSSMTRSSAANSGRQPSGETDRKRGQAADHGRRAPGTA